MTDSHQQATTNSNHLLNSKITLEEKLSDGYNPKQLMSEQHSIGSKNHPHLVYLRDQLYQSFTKIIANLIHISHIVLNIPS